MNSNSLIYFPCCHYTSLPQNATLFPAALANKNHRTFVQQLQIKQKRWSGMINFNTVVNQCAETECKRLN